MTQTQSHMLDDLKIIKGIAKTWENRLHEIGVRTIENLASSEAANIRNKLQTAGHTTSLDVVEDWIEKARVYLTAVKTESPKSEVSTTEWETFAEFFVDYQRRPASGGGWKQRTRVHRMRNGGKDKLWDGIVGEPVSRWMLEQLGEVGLLSSVEEARPLPPTPLPPPTQHPPAATLSIRDAELTQHPDNIPVQLDGTGHMFIYPVRSETPFDLHVVFELKGKLGSSNGGAQHFSTQAYATNKTTGETILLGESEPQPSAPSQSRQTIKLPGIRLQQGLYRLQLIVRGTDQPGSLGFLEVPFLQVV